MPPLNGPWNEERSHVSAKLDEMAATLLRIDESLNGNGQPGLKQRVSALELAVSEDRDGRTWFGRLVVGALVTATVMATTTAGCAVLKVAARMDTVEGKGK